MTQEIETPVCCFTGHRPQKLSRPADDIRIDLENAILAAVREGTRTFISGMACGTDLWAATIVVRLKDRWPDLKLIAAVPYSGFEEDWPEAWRRKYDDLLSRADSVHFISPCCTPSCFQLRNEWMVDHSTEVIAVYNGSPGGTRNTIQYARRKKIPVRILPG